MRRADWLLGDVEGSGGCERLDCQGCEPSKEGRNKYAKLKDERGDEIINVPQRVNQELVYGAVVRGAVLQDEAVKDDTLAGMGVVLVVVVVLRTFGCYSSPLAAALIV